MVEGGGAEVSEAVMVEALEAAQQEINKLCDLQHQLLNESEKSGRKVTKRNFTTPVHPEMIKNFVAAKAGPEVKKVLREHLQKWVLDDKIRALKTALKTEIAERAKTDPAYVGGDAFVSAMVEDILYRESREMVLSDRVRQDGRKWDEIRPITIQVPALPRLHGSAVFTRGFDPSLGLRHARHARRHADHG